MLQPVRGRSDGAAALQEHLDALQGGHNAGKRKKLKARITQLRQRRSSSGSQSARAPGHTPAPAPAPTTAATAASTTHAGATAAACQDPRAPGQQGTHGHCRRAVRRGSRFCARDARQGLSVLSWNLLSQQSLCAHAHAGSAHVSADDRDWARRAAGLLDELVRSVVLAVLLCQAARREQLHHACLIQARHELLHLVSVTFDALMGRERLAIRAPAAQLVINKDAVRL